VTFTRGFVVDPLCCPSRISLLRGQHSHTTGIYQSSSGPYGDFSKVRETALETSTLATWLDAVGYRTGLVGKYLNGYGDAVDYVPPGWDVWRGKVGGYWTFTVSEDGRAVRYRDAYEAGVMTDYAVQFIRSTPPDRPLYLHLNYFAPHAPTDVEERYASDDRCAGKDNLGNPAFDEDTSDKAAHMASPPLSASERQALGVTRVQKACRALLSVDEGVAAVLGALAATGRLDDTLLVFTSDNGVTLGEHRHRGKKVPYENSIGVPFIVRYDPLTHGRSRVDDRLVINLDIAATIVDLVDLDVRPGCPSPPYGACSGELEGRSLVPLLQGSAIGWRDAILAEHYDPPGTGIPTWCMVRTETHKLIRYVTGEEELYDLVADPYELENLLHGSYGPDVRELRNELYARLKTMCDPPPPGLSLP
jgi:N-acetylglucosamine-6-sulfatase